MHLRLLILQNQSKHVFAVKISRSMWRMSPLSSFFSQFISLVDETCTASMMIVSHLPSYRNRVKKSEFSCHRTEVRPKQNFNASLEDVNGNSDREELFVKCEGLFSFDCSMNGSPSLVTGQSKNKHRYRRLICSRSDKNECVHNLVSVDVFATTHYLIRSSETTGCWRATTLPLFFALHLLNNTCHL